MTLLSDQTALK